MYSEDYLQMRQRGLRLRLSNRMRDRGQRQPLVTYAHDQLDKPVIVHDIIRFINTQGNICHNTTPPPRLLNDWERER